MQHEAFQRHGYTVLLPLAGECELGTAAAMLETADPGKQAELCAGVERWNELPVFVLRHALGCGMPFPLPEKPLKLETMDLLAAGLTTCEEAFQLFDSLMAQDYAGSGQKLAWLRGLALALIRTASWKDAEQGMALSRHFAEIERRFLPLCYAPESLREENLFMLPPIHRFGWYCVQAFDALDAGDKAEYVRLLRLGLTEDESAKNMVEFLLENTPQVDVPPNGELLTLAEKVRDMLFALDPSDPAVEALKQSEVYRRVARLIEGTDTRMIRGIMQ